MNRLMKTLWTIVSYAPLYFELGVIFCVDFWSNKLISTSIVWFISFFCLGIISVVVSGLLITAAKKNIPKTKLHVTSASSRDMEITSSMVAYLLPMITLVVSEINVSAFIALIVLLVIMLFVTKTVYINPIIYFFGYKYYLVQVTSGMSYTLITKQKRFNPKKVETVVEIFQEIYMEA